MLTTKPRGTNDFLPGEIEDWQYLEGLIKDLFKLYHYKELRTPIFEHTELFLRSVGETSDIVEKEMYSFEDKGYRHLTLRPEGTAGAVRAYLENKLFAKALPQKLFYIGPMFRYDQPQAGRYRQFHQFGCEAIGTDNPMMDAEVISFALDLFTRLGLNSLAVKLNTVGCDNCRPAYLDKLRAYFEDKKEELCPTCQRRLVENPLRVLDCKEEGCKRLVQEAPTTLDHACTACRTHFEQVRSYLDAEGVDYQVDHTLVRGLDYYTRTAFEVIMNHVGSRQNAICGGGRYNKLVSECGGEETPAIGFAAGLERIILTLKEQGINLPREEGIDLYMVSLGEKASQVNFHLAQSFRQKGFKVELDYLGRSLKAQMKAADREKARYAVIIGDSELENDEIIVRQMASSEQVSMPLADIVNYLEERL